MSQLTSNGRATVVGMYTATPCMSEFGLKKGPKKKYKFIYSFAK